MLDRPRVNRTEKPKPFAQSCKPGIEVKLLATFLERFCAKGLERVSRVTKPITNASVSPRRIPRGEKGPMQSAREVVTESGRVPTIWNPVARKPAKGEQLNTPTS